MKYIFLQRADAHQKYGNEKTKVQVRNYERNYATNQFLENKKSSKVESFTSFLSFFFLKKSINGLIYLKFI